MSEETGNNIYAVYTADTSEDEARLAFIRRFNQEPEKVYRMFPTNTVWVGPVPKKESEGAQWMTTQNPVTSN